MIKRLTKLVSLFNFASVDKRAMHRIKRILVLVLGLCVVTQCTTDKKYDPGLSLSPQEKDELMVKIIRYVAKAPENVGPDEKFKPEYNDYYRERISQTFLERYFVDGSVHYFLVSQPAPSLTEKRHATGGRFEIDQDGSLKEYEEVFRSWKMVPDTLRERSYFLFEIMVMGESLEPYYSKSTSDQYIEFPDVKTYYDKSSRSWKTR